jgi:hypothetical protein
MSRLDYLLVVIAILLTAIAVHFNIWIPVVLLLMLGVSRFYLLTLDRFKPEHIPDPGATQLLQALEEHKEEVKKDLDNMRGKLEIRNARFGQRE